MKEIEERKRQEKDVFGDSYRVHRLSESDSSTVEQLKSSSKTDCLDEESEENFSTQPGPSTESCHPRQLSVIPACFHDDPSEDYNDGAICEICSLKEQL